MQRGGSERDESEPVSIESAPPLARLAAVMALVDLFWNRIVVRVAGGADQDLGIALQRAGVFPRNLAAVAGLVTLVVGLYAFLRMAGYAGLGRRLGISSVAGLLMPAFVLATVLPKERVSAYVVVVALIATNALVILLGTVALQYPAGPRRWASVIATLHGFLVLAGIVTATVPSIAQSGAAIPLTLVAHYGSELAWHLAPVLVLVALFRGQKGAPVSEGSPPGRPALAAAVGIVLTVVALGVFSQLRLHGHRFNTLIYGAIRILVVPESLTWLVGISAGIALAAAIVGMFSSSPARAQLGAAAGLWLAAGSAPHAPGQLLYLTLAALLLARAAQAATVEGRARARIVWSPVPRSV